MSGFVLFLLSYFFFPIKYPETLVFNRHYLLFPDFLFPDRSIIAYTTTHILNFPFSAVVSWFILPPECLIFSFQAVDAKKSLRSECLRINIPSKGSVFSYYILYITILPLLLLHRTRSPPDLRTETGSPLALRLLLSPGL